MSEEEPVSFPQVAELLANDAAESAAKQSTINQLLCQSSSEQVHVTFGPK